MSHPLETVIRRAEPFLLVGDSSQGRFPAQSFHNYAKTNKRFYCLDLGGLTESRGGTKGRKVYTSVEELPDDRSDLAIVWVKPRSAARAVEVAHEAGAKRVWFSFQTGHRDAVARARELGMEVVEIGRCPVHYMAEQVPACRAHTTMLKLAGAYRKPPQTDPDAKRRELF
ncbi:MAG TPA: CoA-binding protein [Sandaracinaceae bacterium LLY-WYZ-13_1]|nr:CoA-binding protein [Sandaracinaceae bacterium LLY-WYZ-13_1]